MSNEVEVYERLMQIGEAQRFSTFFGASTEHAQKIAEHKAWLQNIRHERPNTAHHYRVAIYIRYYNQTKYDNYSNHHDAIVSKAKETADSIVRQAENQAELEIKKAEDEIKKEIVEVSAALANKLLEREINADDHKNLIDSFIEKIGDDND